MKETLAPHEEAPAVPARKCPVVCIGLSVGGLSPLRIIFEQLPANTGMAFVVIHHLRRRPTLLPEILRAHTAMPVLQAADGLPVRPNHVYVLPSGMQISLRDGVLAVLPGKETRGWSDVITTFLLSQARSAHPKVAVILSGLDRDGAAAMRLFKQQGGITIVQELSTAERPEMPHGVLRTGAVDHVLPPDGIAPMLENIAARFKQSTMEANV